MNRSISQHQRLIKELLPQYLKIDDRAEHDLLKFITDISALVHFYDLQNKKDGDWLGFLLRDFSMLLNYVMCIDFKVYENVYHQILSGFATKDNSAELCNQLQHLLLYSEAFSDAFFNLRQQLKNIPQTDAVFLEQINNATADFQRQRDRLNTLKIQANEITQRYNNPGAEATLENVRWQIEDILPAVTSVFHRNQKLYNNLQGLAGYYLTNDLRSDGDVEPHIALLRVFSHLFSHLLKKLNTIPVKHLDYFYNTILDIKYRPAIPDKAHIVVELIPGSPPISVKQGMLLEATDPQTQKKYLYQVNRDQELTDASIKEIKTLYISNFLQIVSNDPAHQHIYEAQVFNASYAYRQPAAFVEQLLPAASWPVLGEDQHRLSDDERTMRDTDIGFMIAAPVLFQQQGRRKFSVHLYFDNPSYNRLQQYIENFAEVSKRAIQAETYDLLKDALIITYTEAKGWEPVNELIIKFNIDAGGKGYLSIQFCIDEAQKPVGNYRQKIHGYALETQWPVLRCIINNNTFHNAYSYLRKLVPEKITIQVAVSEFGLFNLRNNTGLLSTAAPFQAFGAQPVTGAWFDVRNSNVFNKYLKAINVDVQWLDLPDGPGGFERYYEAYNTRFKTASFIADIYNSSDHKKAVTVPQQLFYDYRNAQGNAAISPVSKFTIGGIDTGRLGFVNDFPARELTADIPGYEQTGIRIELAEPAAAFGHKEYLKILPEVLINNAKRSAVKQPLPNTPYTPLVNRLTADFTQEQTTWLTAASNTEAALGFFHIGPFGTGLVFPAQPEQPVTLLPDFDHNANLYIGVENCRNDQELSIFVELNQVDFSNTASEPQPVHWYVLQNSGWVLLNHDHIIYDSTNALMNAGIIQFKLPFLTGKVTGMDPALRWLRASANAALQCRVKGMFAQAFVAERVPEHANSTTGDMIVPPLSITRFSDQLPGIKKIWQLFASFGGLPPESKENYYIRVSEMLWHKNNALTADEMAKAVLNAFPEILFVKCILPVTAHHTFDDAGLLVLVFPYKNDDIANPNEPKICFSKLSAIQAFVQRLLPAFIKPVVLNPVYEKVKVCCKIKFHQTAGDTLTQLLARLHLDIKNYLCPWLTDQTRTIITGQKILQGHLLHFIESRPYVSYVTSFSLLHFYQEKDAAGEALSVINDTAVNNSSDQTADDISICSSLPYAILVPANNHNIEVIEITEMQEATPTGLAGLEFGNEFSVFYKDETLEPENDSWQTIDDSGYRFTIEVDHIN